MVTEEEEFFFSCGPHASFNIPEINFTSLLAHQTGCRHTKDWLLSNRSGLGIVSEVPDRNNVESGLQHCQWGIFGGGNRD